MIKMVFTTYEVGKRESLTFGREATYGTTVAVDSRFGYNCVFTPNTQSKGFGEIINNGSDELTITDMAQGGIVHDFTLTFNPVNWNWLDLVVGTVSETGTAPVVADYSVANSVQSFTIQRVIRGASSRVITYAGSVVTSARISFSKPSGDSPSFIEVTLNCIAQKIDPLAVTETTVSVVSGEPFKYNNTLFKFDGTEYVEINSGEINMIRGIVANDSRYCNSSLDRYIGEPIPKTFRINGSLNVNIKDSTYYDAWQTDDAIEDCEISFTLDANTNMTFGFNNLWITNLTNPTVFDGVSSATITYTADKFSTLEEEY